MQSFWDNPGSAACRSSEGFTVYLLTSGFQRMVYPDSTFECMVTDDHELASGSSDTLWPALIVFESRNSAIVVFESRNWYSQLCYKSTNVLPKGSRGYSSMKVTQQRGCETCQQQAKSFV